MNFFKNTNYNRYLQKYELFFMYLYQEIYLIHTGLFINKVITFTYFYVIL